MAMSEEKDKIDTDCRSIIEEYADVFQGIGEFPGECNFRVDPDTCSLPTTHDPYNPTKPPER